MKYCRLILFILSILYSIIFLLPAGCKDRSSALQSDSSRYLALLKTIPANNDTLKRAYVQDLTELTVKMQEYSQITEKRAIMHPHQLSGLGQYYDESEWQQTVGFTVKNVENNILAGTFPDTYQVVHTNIDENTFQHAIETGPLNDILRIDTYEGVQYYSWGEDNKVDLENRSSFRPLGIGGRTAYIDGFVFWANWTAGIKDMITCYTGKTESLADLKEYRLLAEGLAKLDALNVLFSSQPLLPSTVMEWYQKNLGSLPDNIDSERKQRFQEAVVNIRLLDYYQAFASGVGIDENGYYMAIVLLNADETTAKNNADLLLKRIQETQEIGRGNYWADTITQMEIKQQDNLTLAKLYGEIAEAWYRVDIFESQFEPLLACNEPGNTP